MAVKKITTIRRPVKEEVTDKNVELAERFCNALKELASSDERLDNFKGYLEWHFPVWFERFITTPEGLVSEIEQFARI